MATSSTQDAGRGAADTAKGPGAGRTNKRTHAKDALDASSRAPSGQGGKPQATGASGMAAGGGLGGRVANTISAAVVSVTSRPAGPIAVDARETTATVEVLRTPDDGTEPAGVGASPTPRDGAAAVPNSPDQGAAAPSCTASPRGSGDAGSHDGVKDAGKVRDDLLEREAAGDPSLRASVTDAVVDEGLPRAEDAAPDPHREAGPDADDPAR